MKMEPIVSSETSAIRTQTPGIYPKRTNYSAKELCQIQNSHKNLKLSLPKRHAKK